ncbi:MAG: rod shape-determining protein MreD [Alteromonadaceae bacterium]|nr:MAG: rod shape-determining protein MreD [Alteromonadaceae bacterium]
MYRLKNPVTVHLFIAFTLIFGLLLAIFPISTEYAYLRPEFVCVILVYWCINIPQHPGIFYAWCVGLLQDIVEGGVWGGHAMALAVIAYICMVSHQRMKSYSLWRQTFWLFVLVGMHQAVINWMQGLLGYRTAPMLTLASSATSALMWPVMYVVLGRIRKMYHVH